VVEAAPPLAGEGAEAEGDGEVAGAVFKIIFGFSPMRAVALPPAQAQALR